jgi:hypothetical protein
MVYDNTIEAGNKLIANTGKIKMYGKSRGNKMTRLRAPANKGDTSITVESGLDWQAGDQIGIVATSTAYTAADYATVLTYNSGSGAATLNSTLNHYHWGNATSTAWKYNGVDIRGEVVLLTRNIKIAGEDIQGWGGQIVTSSTVESDGTIRTGQVIMDNVEIYNCSQTNTLKAAFRIEGSIPGVVNASSLTNSVVHNGLGWGIHIINSAHVKIENNVIFGFKPIGVGFQTV